MEEKKLTQFTIPATRRLILGVFFANTWYIGTSFVQNKGNNVLSSNKNDNNNNFNNKFK